MNTSPRARTAAAAPLGTVAATMFAGLALAGPADARGPVEARKDAVNLVAGQTARINVLGNDRLLVKRGAKVRLTAVPTPDNVIVGSTRRQRVVIKTTTATKPGRYTATYKVTDKRGRTDKARVLITVKATTIPTSTPTPTATPAPTTSATPTPTPSATPTLTPASSSLTAVIESLPVATEVRTGYDRALFKHWNSGLPAGSGGIPYCDTRDEVLISESSTRATWSGTSCTITGSWYSYYDGVSTTDPSTFDIDHMVALAEAWDSGAHSWTAAQRETYANDQGDPRSLVAVSASSNRGKGDQDPGEWWPLLERCRYAAEWTATKARFGLTVDRVEKDALLLQASQCGTTTVTYTNAW